MTQSGHGADDHHEVAEEPSPDGKGFIDLLRDLIFFAANGHAQTWRAMWTEWPYSSVVDYALQLASEKRKVNEELHDALSEAKDPLHAIFVLLVHKLQ